MCPHLDVTGITTNVPLSQDHEPIQPWLQVQRSTPETNRDGQTHRRPRACCRGQAICGYMQMRECAEVSFGRARASVNGWKRETFMCGRYEIADGARILVRFDVANTTPTILGNLDVQPTQRAE